MPSALYALASDTLIGVVRAWAIARTQHTGEVLADDEATPMAIIGGLFLWLLRTLSGVMVTAVLRAALAYADTMSCRDRSDDRGTRRGGAVASAGGIVCDPPFR
jgi:hypothetical protein